ncbi:MAG: BolA family protein [Methyloligellaceae bacterium]
MSVSQTIETLLKQAFSPVQLEIINESHKHQGHAGSPGTGESHFRITIVSETFQGKSRVECHRMVNDVLSEQISGPVHALAIKASAP